VEGMNTVILANDQSLIEKSILLLQIKGINEYQIISNLEEVNEDVKVLVVESILGFGNDLNSRVENILNLVKKDIRIIGVKDKFDTDDHFSKFALTIIEYLGSVDK
jgi:hypoxanthine-guanine phosphoribosyltransferase